MEYGKIFLIMNENVYFYKEKEDHTIKIVRVFGNHPCVVIPETIDGKIVDEIGEYCFSKSIQYKDCQKTEGDLSFMSELSLQEIESVSLPNTIKKIGSYAFYNCRKCKRIELSNAVNEIGSDVFLNCLSLHTIQMNCSIQEVTILKLMLKQISWDIDICFKDGTFLFPEYYENYNVIGPAHIFGMNINGEGYRTRQCFENQYFQVQEYDEIFERLCIEESTKTLCHFAWNRILYPIELSEYNQKTYLTYLKEHIHFWAMEILKHDELDLIFQYKKMVEIGLMDKDTINTLIEEASKLDLIELTTHLIQWKKEYFQSNNNYEFEEFE